MYAFLYIPVVDGCNPLALAVSFLFSIYKKVIKNFCRQMQTISRSAQKSCNSRGLAELCEWWAGSLHLNAGRCWLCVPCLGCGEAEAASVLGAVLLCSELTEAGDGASSCEAAFFIPQLSLTESGR